MQYETIDQKDSPYGTVEIVQLDRLKGSSDVRSAEQLFFISQAGMRLKMVKITLPHSTSKARVEPGALYFMNGNLEIKASTGGGLMSGLKRRFLTGESLFVNEIHGKGEIFLEPSFGHFILVDIENDEIIVDKRMFYGALGDVTISAHVNTAVSGIAGGEGFFQTSIKGSGVAILFSPVPMDEVQAFTLDNTVLRVDGNFALMRTSGVTFSIEKSSKSWVATSVSGEGLLQTFRGKGTVWIAPTQGVYERLSRPGGLEDLSGPPGSKNTKVTT